MQQEDSFICSWFLCESRGELRLWSVPRERWLLRPLWQKYFPFMAEMLCAFPAN